MIVNFTKHKLAEELKDGVEILWKEKCGCCHWHLLTDDKKRRWSIVLGWNDSGFDDRDNETYYVDSGCAISCKIGYEERCNAMQTDMDWDFTMPYDEETGEVDDTCSPVSRNENFEELADYLLKEFKRVTDTWAYWKPEEEEVA